MISGLAEELDQRLAERVEQARIKREARQAERVARKARRDAGLVARHASKLARLQEERS